MVLAASLSVSRAQEAPVHPAFAGREVKTVDDPWSKTQKPFRERMGRAEVVWSDEGSREEMIVVEFRRGSSLVLADYHENARHLERLRAWFSNERERGKIECVVITASASPEGSHADNEALAMARARAVKSYIMWQFPHLDRDLIHTFSAGEDWVGLRRSVVEDPDVPYRREVLRVLSESDYEDRYARLRTIGGGVAFDYLTGNTMPRLRRAVAAQIRYKEKPAVLEVEPVVATRTEAVVAEVQETGRAEMLPPRRERRPLLAAKTNLLFDAATASNVEIEVPIGRRWSIAGEYVFPWWHDRKKRYVLELIAATIEARYWFGGRENTPRLTGWFAGVHAGGGYYDIAWKTRRHQGEFFHAGVSGGFAHAISKNRSWRMEYSLGVGYMGDRYREYSPGVGTGGKPCMTCRRKGELKWFGPTRAKISLVWMIHRKQPRIATASF